MHNFEPHNPSRRHVRRSASNAAERLNWLDPDAVSARELLEDVANRRWARSAERGEVMRDKLRRFGRFICATWLAAGVMYAAAEGWPMLYEDDDAPEVEIP